MTTMPARIARFIGRILVRFARILLLLGIVAAAAAAAGYHWLDEHILSTLPADLSSFREYRPPTVVSVKASDGTEIDQFYLERRIWVPLSELPPAAWQSFIAAEDRRFLKHGGVDLFGIARALYTNFQAGRKVQGGSTLTQQLVKNLLVGHERSYERKLKEAVLAFRLERELTKEEILELYVNYVFLGSGNYGLEAAARDYFGISARELNPGQAALLAGLVPAPSRYSPRTHPTAAQWRRSVVLRTMVEEGFVQQEEAERYLGDPVIVPRDAGRHHGEAIAYATQVRREIRRIMGEREAWEHGLQVQTPLDLGVQRVADGAVRRALRSLEERQGRRGAIKHLEPAEWEGFTARAAGLVRDVKSGAVLAPDKGDCFQALVGPAQGLENLWAGPFRYRLAAADRAVRVRSILPEKPARPLQEQVRPGDVLRVCKADGDEVRLEERPWAEGAAVVVENATGRIVALVGGYEVGIEGFVRATQARRQPGSSFKPYVYAAGLLEGKTQIDTVLDAPISMPAGGGRTWSPKNYTNDYKGPLPMRRAMAQSLNTVAVRLALDAGPAQVARLAEAMGVRTPLRKDITMALGSSEVTPMDQAMGYATIARMGVPTDPVYIDKLTDVRGRIVGRAGGPIHLDGETPAKLPGGPLPRALPAGVAYELADMLREVVRGGTARAAYKADYDRAGKTGTTNGYVDAWFVGFTPRYTVAVWVGTDGTFSLGEKETGGRTALPAWIEIVEALEQPAGERFAVPDDAVLVQSEQGWVGLARAHVPAKVLHTPDPGAAPLPAFPGAGR
ncbi:penicillin-binding protein 1A [Vulgatibacter sp.]|uniref:penicillin-binding protein 1A n=1 Tax=Vulgatibacter sp. TaxID=1971226 RepID=UPI0035642404